MLDNLKKILNEDQDAKAIDKITEKLVDLLMKGEEVGYIAVQKKPALTVFPDSVVLTDKRIIVCKPKNLGLSMSFTDYDWDLVVAPFIKEGILGSEFSFVTKTDITVTMDYLPKNQARKLYTFAKEQLEVNRNTLNSSTQENTQAVFIVEQDDRIEELIPEVLEATIITEEVTDFTHFYQSTAPVIENTPTTMGTIDRTEENNTTDTKQKTLDQLSKEELFEKLQNYKKLLDNGLILQGEYDTLKNEIIKHL